MVVEELTIKEDPETLVELINRLESGNASPWDRRDALENFFSENPYAHQVARGEASYVEDAQKVRKKYHRRLFSATIPQPDLKFDKMMSESVRSMLSVGIDEFYLDEPIHPLNYVTARLNKQRKINGLVIVASGVVSLGAVITKLLGFPGANYLAAGGVPMMIISLGVYLSDLKHLNEHIENLTDYAQKSENYVRAQYQSHLVGI